MEPSTPSTVDDYLDVTSSLFMHMFSVLRTRTPNIALRNTSNIHFGLMRTMSTPSVPILAVGKAEAVGAKVFPALSPEFECEFQFFQHNRPC